MATARSPRTPRWYAVPARAVFVTFLLTLLSFAITLAITIATMVITAWVRGANPDMRLAYRHVALPVAVVVGGVVLLLTLFVEICHYRQARTLAGIARASR